MRINWFSPLPPARTEIAHYTARILPALARSAEVVLWTDQAEWDCSLEEIATVRRFTVETMPWEELQRADVSVYHVGNNANFHGPIWRVSKLHPGIVILHDLSLQGFFLYYQRELWGTDQAYLDQMASYYGLEGRRAAEKILAEGIGCDVLADAYPLYEPAIDHSLGVVVHSRSAFDEIAKQRKWPVCFLDLPYKELRKENPAPPEPKEAGPPYRLILFGYIGGNRRLVPFLEALAGFPRRDLLTFDIYGELWDEGYVRERIAALGLTEEVAIHGYVTEAELDAALARAHLAINLRYPSFGESSSSQLRIWSQALPSIVTRVGWYADQPDTALAFVRPGHEAEDIHVQLNSFLDRPEQLAIMGAAGRRILHERHCPDTYVNSLMGFLADTERFTVRAVTNEMLRRLGKEIASTFGQNASDLLLEKVAAELSSIVAD